MCFLISPPQHLCPVSQDGVYDLAEVENINEHIVALSSVPFFPKRHYLNMTERTVNVQKTRRAVLPVTVFVAIISGSRVNCCEITELIFSR